MTRSRELAELATAYDTGTPLGFRNRLINSDMRIDQRNAGATVNTDLAFPLDRWKAFRNGGAATFTSQRSTVAPANATNSLLYTVGTGAAPGASDYSGLSQTIEGFNIADLGWGTASAKPVTMSFKVRSSVTGSFGLSLRNSANNRSYIASFTIAAANTWETKTITVPGDTTGTWLTDNGAGLVVLFDLGVGSTFSDTAGSWLAANKFGLTGGTKLIATSGATFHVTEVQLEAGSVATPFERRPFELALCMRYYQNLNNWFEYATGATGNANAPITMFSVPMRASPTITNISVAAANNTFTGYTVHSRNGVFFGYNIVYNSSTTGYAYRQSTDALNSEL
jgi:hypothetical protein